MLLSKNNSIKNVEILLKKGANPNYPFCYFCSGQTPLTYAIEYNNIKIVELLLKYGANINIQYENNEITPLMTACFCNYIEIVKILLKYDNDFTIKNSNNMTALIMAFQNNNYKIVQLLITQNFYKHKLMKVKKLNLNMNKLIYKI